MLCQHGHSQLFFLQYVTKSCTDTLVIVKKTTKMSYSPGKLKETGGNFFLIGTPCTTQTGRAEMGGCCPVLFLLLLLLLLLSLLYESRLYANFGADSLAYFEEQEEFNPHLLFVVTKRSLLRDLNHFVGHPVIKIPFDLNAAIKKELLFLPPPPKKLA